MKYSIKVEIQNNGLARTKIFIGNQCFLIDDTMTANEVDILTEMVEFANRYVDLQES